MPERVKEQAKGNGNSGFQESRCRKEYREQ